MTYVDNSRRPFQIPPDFQLYAERHDIFDMTKRLLESILLTRPADPVEHALEFLKRDDEQALQIVVLGPPASGKRTLAKKIAAKIGCIHLTTEYAYEEAPMELKMKARSYIDDGEDVPAELWAKIFHAKVSTFEASKRGYIMDDYPRTRKQAEALRDMCIFPKQVLILELNEATAIERAEGKRIDPETNDIYHTTFDWPHNDNTLISRLKPVVGNDEDEVVKRFEFYERYNMQLHSFYQSVATKINGDQPKADVFLSALETIRQKHRSQAPFVPRILLLGAQGSGKCKQAELLQNKYGLTNVRVGSLVKTHVARETPLGIAAKSYHERQARVPDHIVMNMLKEVLCSPKATKGGWILHGFPATCEQIDNLFQSGLKPNRVYVFDISEMALMERLSERALDPITGETYHMLYNPPRDDQVKTRLVSHPKDQSESIRSKIQLYESYKQEIIEYLSSQKDVALFTINADQDPHTIFELIESALVKPTPFAVDDLQRRGASQI